MPRVLFLSNGHGEDAVGAAIAFALNRLLEKDPLSGVKLSAMPIVGFGRPYGAKGIEIVGPRREMPSGGFIYLSVENLQADFRVGLWKLIRAQIKFLRDYRNEIDLVVGVGDRVILGIDACLLKKPMVFVGIADSSHYTGGARPAFSPWQRRVMRRFCVGTFVRDELTAASLRAHGVPGAVCAGNPMMDTFPITGVDFGLDPKAIPIGILPGSRGDAPANLACIMRIAQALRERVEEPLVFLVAAAPTVDREELERCRLETAPGIEVVISESFGDVLAASRLVIGLSGTGNEQAAGLGKPVVAFPGPGRQYTERFMEAQRRLLGGALLTVPANPREAADRIASLLRDPKRMEAMSSAGIQRMGGRGASLVIAKRVHELLSRRCPA